MAEDAPQTGDSLPSAITAALQYKDDDATIAPARVPVVTFEDDDALRGHEPQSLASSAARDARNSATSISRLRCHSSTEANGGLDVVVDGLLQPYLDDASKTSRGFHRTELPSASKRTRGVIRPLSSRGMGVRQAIGRYKSRGLVVMAFESDERKRASCRAQ